MSSYFIDRSNSINPRIEVEENTTNTETSLVFPGKGIIPYAEIIAENFVKLLENFSSYSSYPPENPVQGQLWYKTLSPVPINKSTYSGEYDSSQEYDPGLVVKYHDKFYYSLTEVTTGMFPDESPDAWALYKYELMVYNGVEWDSIAEKTTEFSIGNSEVITSIDTQISPDLDSDSSLASSKAIKEYVDSRIEDISTSDSSIVYSIVFGS